METYLNTEGVECVRWTDEQGNNCSMVKSAYDEMLEQAEQSTPNLPGNADKL
jgi:hypothetical protein